MIIKSNRISTGASRRRLVDHLLHGEENDYVEVLQGSERDIADFCRDAQVHGAPKSLRVWIIAPSQETSRDQAFEAVDALAREFDFDPSQATVVEHGKGRVTPDAFDRHWHVVIGEVDPSSGRVLSSSHDHPRHEFLARLLEARWGHTFVLGAHTRSVLARMRRDGHDATADLLSAAFEPHAGEAPPREAYTTAQHQASKRRGTSMPQDLEVVADAWRTAVSLSGLTSALAEAGLELSRGDVEWVVRRDGVLLGSLRRLLRMRKATFTTRMEELIHGNHIDVTDAVPGRDNAFGAPADRGGSRRPERVRGPPGPPVERRRELFGGGRPAPVATRRRDRGDAPAPGGVASGNDRARHRTRDETRDPGGLTAAAFVDAVVALLPAAESIATPAASAAAAVLDRYEADARLRLAGAPEGPSREDLDAAKALAVDEQAKLNALNTKIYALNGGIGSLLRAQQQRRRSVWGRWFPDLAADAELSRLRTWRDELLEEHKRAERPMLSAVAAEARAQRNFAAAVAAATASHVKAVSAARTRLSAIARARRVLILWPAVAYAGVRKMIELGVRIEKAKRKGWDSGPSPHPRSSRTALIKP